MDLAKDHKGMGGPEAKSKAFFIKYYLIKYTTSQTGGPGVIAPFAPHWIHHCL